ncbi:MAG: universal stress protein [Vulcanimicrobiaceae bacterium]
MQFFNKVLIAIDESAPSQYAIDVGVAIANVDRSPVVFAAVLDPALVTPGTGALVLSQLVHNQAEALIERAMREAQSAGLEASSKILFENVTRGIIGLAGETGAGLIVMGTHARSGFARIALRSVAEAVLRATSVPLCIVRRPRIGKVYSRFLVPIVDDGLSEAAVTYATEVARGFNSSLLFFTVCSEREDSRARTLVQSAQEQATRSGVVSETLVAHGERNVAATIAQSAHAQECDVIIMASHRREGLPRLIEGSVAEAVIRSSSMPVVVVGR